MALWLLKWVKKSERHLGKHPKYKCDNRAKNLIKPANELFIKDCFIKTSEQYDMGSNQVKGRWANL